MILVVTGPSGVGKGTLIRLVRERVPELQLSVSATTRSPRPGEEDGADYFFLTPEAFAERVDAGDFVEHAEYAGRRYGTLREELERQGSRGPVLLEIEVQGARQVREALPDAVTIFIEPPSPEALRDRLIGRGTDDPEAIEARLETAERELAAAPEFDYRVCNDRLDDAADRLELIVRRHATGTLGA